MITQVNLLIKKCESANKTNKKKLNPKRTLIRIEQNITFLTKDNQYLYIYIHLLVDLNADGPLSNVVLIGNICDVVFCMCRRRRKR